MTFNSLNKYSIHKNSTLNIALKKFDKTGNKCLIVLDSHNNFIGTLSNGDIRRSILKKISLSENISKIYNRKPYFFYEDEYTDKECKKIFLKKKLDIIPVINRNKKIIDLKMNYDFIIEKNNNINASVIIMAGGQGKRMKPFTDVLPKPLIPINNKTVIEHIMDGFNEFNIFNFYISLNYKSKILKSYLLENKNNNNIKFVTEKNELGTIGSLSLFSNKFKDSFFVINCDTILKINYLEFYNFHKKNNFDLTIAASSKEFEISYGSIELLKNGSLKKINEKPKFDFLINTGLYIINPNLIKLVPKNRKLDFNQFIHMLKKRKIKIGVFPLSDENWMDVGGWSQYQKTISKLF